jgi:methionine sulfoxide reductase catalytic subunit
MHVLRRRGWEGSERLVTPEALVLGRRAALAGAGAVALATPALAQTAAGPVRNAKYVAGRDITPEKYPTT